MFATWKDFSFTSKYTFIRRKGIIEIIITNSRFQFIHGIDLCATHLKENSSSLCCLITQNPLSLFRNILSELRGELQRREKLPRACQLIFQLREKWVLRDRIKPTIGCGNIIARTFFLFLNRYEVQPWVQPGADDNLEVWKRRRERPCRSREEKKRMEISIKCSISQVARCCGSLSAAKIGKYRAAYNSFKYRSL